MNSLVAAYVAVWMAVSLYTGWLGVRQNRLSARLAALEAEIAGRDGASDAARVVAA